MRSGKNWQSASGVHRPSCDLRHAGYVLAMFLLASCLSHRVDAQITALPRADSASGDFFGTSVAVHLDRVLVGATGVSTCGTNSGAAYVYRRSSSDGETWSLEATLEPDDCELGAFFGRSVDLSDRFAVVAASREYFNQETPNAVYVFERDTTDGAWSQVAKLTGGPASLEGSFANSVSLDGNRLLVTATGDLSGNRVHGAAHLFDYDPSTRQWVRRLRLEGSGSLGRGVFGTSGAIDGEVAAVTASTYARDRPGSLYIFEADPIDGWIERRFGGIDDFFISLAVDDGRVLVGESEARNGSGTATLFEKNAEGQWHVSHVLRPQKPYDSGAFGSAVTLDGDLALVMGFDEQLGLDFNIDRVVFVFKRDPASGHWRQHQVLDVGEVAFGTDIDVQDRYAVIGSASEDRPGAAYVARLP